MNMNQMTAMKARLSAAVDEVGLEIVRLSNMRKALQQCLADAEAIINTEVAAKAMGAKLAAAKPAAKKAEAPKAAPVAKKGPAKVATKKAAPAAKAPAAKVPAKAAPAAKAPAKAAPVAKAAPPNGAKPNGAKPNGLKPTLRQAITQVLGKQSMNADQVLALLQEKGWAPNAKDPRGYVAHRLCSNKDSFEPDQTKGRGFYRVRRAETQEAPKAAPVAKAAPAAKAPTKKAAPAAKKAAPAAKAPTKKAAPAAKKTDEEILDEFGIKPSAVVSPFDNPS